MAITFYQGLMRHLIKCGEVEKPQMKIKDLDIYQPSTQPS